MKGKKKSFKLVLFLLMACMVLAFSMDKNTYANTKKIKWTATIAKKTYTYTGKKIKPKVTVKYKGKKLTKKNYTVKYPKNPIDENKYKIKVSLKGKYKGRKLKGTKTIKYKIYDRSLHYHKEQVKKDPNDVLVTKKVKGISIAYNKGRYPFYKYTDVDESSGKKKIYAQCYFPIYIKQKVNKNFIFHAQYNGICGFNNFSDGQYIPNRKDAQVAVGGEVYYYYKDDVTRPYDEFQKKLYKKGYIGFIMVRVSCLLNKKQSVDLYLDDEKIVTLESNKFSKLKEYDDYEFYYQFGNPLLVPVYSYETETMLKNMLSDVAKCAPNMTDFETFTALNYWIASHRYSEFTCWGAIVVGEAMTELGYPYIQLACSYNDGNGGFYNDYFKYYSLRSKLDDAGYNSLGHRITLIFNNSKQFWYCQVQGSADEDGGNNSSKKFVFNPSGWTRPTNDVSESLFDITDKMPLNEYDNIKQLMKGDYEMDIEQYNPFDWHTWKTYW